MDNLCHALVGAALGEAGLKRRTRWGNAALIVGANIPDLDVLVFATGMSPVAFRRGWTHGVLAQVVLPALLTGVLVLIARARERRTSIAREAGAGHSPPMHAGWMLALCYVGLYSHIFLDYLNTYGVRLLAPLDWRWFYGDSVFIIDPWLWLGLGTGVWLTRRRAAPWASRAALVFAAAYVAIMLLSARGARTIVEGAWHDASGTTPRALMVGPAPITPFTREVIVDAGDHYVTGTFSWSTSAVTFDPKRVPKNDTRPEVAVAREAPEFRAILVWSRFPVWELEPVEGGTRVTLRDMRIIGRGTFSATTIVARLS